MDPQLENTTKYKRFLEIRAQAEVIAGPQSSLRYRARGYLEIYRTSNGACLFALVAAHGALWASWYLVCAKVFALAFCILDITSFLTPAKKYRDFDAYVGTLKEINKLVMIETYVLVHTVQELGVEFAISQNFPEELVKNYADAIFDDGTSKISLRDLYHAHFLWEQERVVSTKLDDAFAVFDWPKMRNLCQRPWVWFSYFRAGKSMNFTCFTDQDERVEKGMIAYDRAVSFGIEKIVFITLTRLDVFPGMFLLRQNLISKFRRGETKNL